MNLMLDDSGWPLVQLTMADRFDRAAADAIIGGWEKLLSRQSRFGIVVVQTSTERDGHDREASADYRNWCKANKSRIEQYCTGMGMVMASSKMLALYKPLAGITIRKTYGCPGQVFGDTAAAADWVRERIGGKQ